MGNTYTQLFVHVVFTVQSRNNLIAEKHRTELEKYICGILANVKCNMLAIYCNPDHSHLLIGYKPDISIADIVRDIKSNSSRFINGKKWIVGKFNWQDGYGAFTCSKSQLDRVGRYILNQEMHHKKKTFKDEYVELLNKCGVEYDSKYLFDWIT
jgi:REP element-mobilizing transposase RayT